MSVWKRLSGEGQEKLAGKERSCSDHFLFSATSVPTQMLQPLADQQQDQLASFCSGHCSSWGYHGLDSELQLLLTNTTLTGI